VSFEFDVIASFADEQPCARAVEDLRKAGSEHLRYFAPIPSERIFEAAGFSRSPVRRWVLGGGITGALSGFALTIGTSLTWSHVAGGKPIVSIPPYIIIAFELMILFGALSAVIGFLVNGGVPEFQPLSGYSPRFSSDRFGVVVRCDEEEAERVESIMREAGAEEVAREPA
jgi:Alternative complex III, ActD subunit